MLKIKRPVETPITEQEIGITPGAIAPSGDLSWVVPLLITGVNPVLPEGEKGKPPAPVAGAVKMSVAVLDGGDRGSVLRVTVLAMESNGLPVDDKTPQKQLGSFEVTLDAALSNAGVPRQ